MKNVPPFSHTCRYMAPEMMLAQPYTKTVDLWSMGCLFCEMLTGSTPFKQDPSSVKQESGPDYPWMQQVLRSVVMGQIELPPSPYMLIGPVEQSFILGFLNREPSLRLGAQGGMLEIITHPMFAVGTSFHRIRIQAARYQSIIDNTRYSRRPYSKRRRWHRWGRRQCRSRRRLPCLCPPRH